MNTYFLERRLQKGGAELALRFPLPYFFIDGLTLEKLVIVQLKFDAGSGGHALTIGWKPVGAGPLPGFDGTLIATPHSEAACELTIAGSYAPPGAFVGRVFDQIIGRRIARATITALLEQFRTSIEADYMIRLIP